VRRRSSLSGQRHPRSAYRPASRRRRPYFIGLNNELPTGSSSPDSDLITWPHGSLMWILRASLLRVEMMQMSMPRYDAERFGFCAARSPRQSDVMIVRRQLTNKMAPACARSTTRCGPRYVISMGSCAMAAATITIPTRSGALRRIVPVDIYVPGCPPTAEALLYGVLLLQKKIVVRPIER